MRITLIYSVLSYIKLSEKLKNRTEKWGKFLEFGKYEFAMKTFTTYVRKILQLGVSTLCLLIHAQGLVDSCYDEKRDFTRVGYMCVRELMSRKAFSDRVINILQHASLRSMP